MRGNFSAWLGPYKTGETANTSHKWSNKGHYKIRVKSWDRYNGTSDWSDPLDIYLTEITLNIKNRFFFITAQIKNTGDYRFTKIDWSLTISGDNIKVFPNRNREGTIWFLGSRRSRRMFTSIIGLSEITITLTACNEKKIAKGFVIGPFIFLD